jgi:hypothetical protein
VAELAPDNTLLSSGVYILENNMPLPRGGIEERVKYQQWYLKEKR